MITCSRQYGILARPCSRMMTAITFGSSGRKRERARARETREGSFSRARVFLCPLLPSAYWQTTFSRQNDAGSRASNTHYWENLELVSESKALYFYVPNLLSAECIHTTSVEKIDIEIDAESS